MVAPNMTNPDNSDAQIFHHGPQSTLKAIWVKPYSRSHEAYVSHLCDPLGTWFARNHPYVWAMPSRNDMDGFQSSSRSFVISRSFRGVPSGLVVSQASSPSKPTTSQISSASSRIEMSSPQPTLMISGESYFSSSNTHADARSFTCKNSRRGSPEPHTMSSRSFRVLASCALRKSAARTCDVSRSKLSLGP